MTSNDAKQMTPKANDIFLFSVLLHALRVSVVPSYRRARRVFSQRTAEEIQGNGEWEMRRPDDQKTKRLRD